MQTDDDRGIESQLLQAFAAKAAPTGREKSGILRSWAACGANGLKVRAFVALVLICVAGYGDAHHSYAAEFDANSPATIEGVVREVWFKNPHVRYYVTVIDKDGNSVLWDTRGLTPVKLVRQGWTKKTIQVGDRIKIHGHVGHTNKTIMSILDITLSDGRILSSRSVAYDIKIEEQE